MVRHMFAGGNTPNGFFSYFNHILPLEKSNQTIYLKGGSGTGKSTFMKKVGTVFEDQGYDIEYFHCSNDPESVDGICIPKIGAALIDATSPHMQDPVIPRAADEILNLAVCLNAEGLKSYKNELQGILAKKKQLIQMAYGYLHAAYSVYKNASIIYVDALNQAAVSKITNEMIHTVFSDYKCADTLGKQRKLFATALTPNGFVDYSETLFHTERQIVFYGREGLGSDEILSRIQTAATERGFDTEGYYSPLMPESLEHLIIPALSICFVTKNAYHSEGTHATKEYNLYELCREDAIQSHKGHIECTEQYFKELSEKGMKLLKESTLLHTRVEEIYIANMDFDKLDSIYHDTIEQLLRLEGLDK